MAKKPKKKKGKAKKKRPSKYEKPLKLDATFEEVIKLAMSGNPKSKKD